jgi:hypothetical protein
VDPRHPLTAISEWAAAAELEGREHLGECPAAGAASGATVTIRVGWTRRAAFPLARGVDPMLGPFGAHFSARQARLLAQMDRVEAAEGGLDAFSRGYERFGFTRGGGGGPGVEGIWLREWLPDAREVSLVGDFNGWDAAATPLARGEHGVWSVFLPDAPSGAAARQEERQRGEHSRPPPRASRPQPPGWRPRCDAPPCSAARILDARFVDCSSERQFMNGAVSFAIK